MSELPPPDLFGKAGVIITHDEHRCDFCNAALPPGTSVLMLALSNIRTGNWTLSVLCLSHLDDFINQKLQGRIRRHVISDDG